MGRIMLATSNSTDEEYGGTYVARADEIEPVLVLSIPANTYNTWALALARMKTAYDALTNDMKLKTIIKQGDGIFHLANINGTYTRSTISGTALYTMSLSVYDGSYKYRQNENAVVDSSSDSQNSQLNLYII